VHGFISGEEEKERKLPINDRKRNHRAVKRRKEKGEGVRKDSCKQKGEGERRGGKEPFGSCQQQKNFNHNKKKKRREKEVCLKKSMFD